MGQYYAPSILSKNYRKAKINNVVIASLYAHEWAEGLKLTEHSYIGNNFVKAAMHLIALHKGKPFVWCGDYADKNFKDEQGKEYNVFNLQKNVNPSQLGTMLDANNIDFKSNYKYIVNYSKREYVKLPEEPKNNNWRERIIHPLPLLTADGNQQGGGDYYGINEDFVGRWAYDRIGVTNKRPHYKRLKIEFKENY